MQKILLLWATPRSTSTPFEWMMRQRGDFTCFHEPFGYVWYYGDEARSKRRTTYDGRAKGLTFAGTYDQILTAANSNPVFVKDFPYYIKHMWTNEFLSRFSHSFLIRDPAKVLASMFKTVPDYGEDEVGFVEQHQLFDRLCQDQGQVPPLIDSDDLFEDPQKMVKSYCDAVGIPFVDHALTWDPPGEGAKLSWYEGASWQDSLRQSTGLHAKPRTAGDPSILPPAARKIYDQVLPYYLEMHKHRIR